MTNFLRITLACLVINYINSTSLQGQGTDLFETPANIKSANKPSANSNINQVDQNGKKQGKWEKKYANGKTAYTATFKDNKPVGTLTRYHETGNLMARICYNTLGDKGRAELYDENGKLIATGNYIGNNLKDSTWNFFSSQGVKTSTENYLNGRKNGPSFTYYPNGKVSEEINWTMDKKNGRWLQYFNGGEIKLQSQHIDDKIHGPYLYYYADGKIEITGTYYMGLEDGKWVYFNADGTTKNETEFVRGQPKNPEPFEKQQKAMFEEMDDNKDDLLDPEKFKDNPDQIINAK